MIFKTSSKPAKTAFFHVMKTGGSTFQAILSAIYGDSFQICHDASLAAIAASVARFNCLEFHIKPAETGWICLHGELVRQRRWDLLKGWHAFTMVRDPVDQVLSEYFYLQTIRSQVEPLLHARGMEFADSLRQYLRSASAYNDQLAFLVGKTQGPGSCVTRDDLAVAKEMLTELRMHVGLTERFGDSMNVFEAVTGLRIPDAGIRNQNRNAGRPKLKDVSSRIRDQIRENSALDLELYEWGREILTQDLARCGKTRSYGFLTAAGTSKENSPEKTLREPKEAAVFLHIMRTGGRTFRSFLASVYGASYHVCDEVSLDSVEASLGRFACNVFQTQSDGASAQHTHAELVRQRRWELLEGAQVFTLLREPVDHVVSMYSFLVQSRRAVEPLLRLNGISFPETLEEYLDRDWHRDSQLAFLMGRHSMRPGHAVSREDLAEAKEMLTRLGCHVGLTERFNDFLHLFETLTGRKSKRELPLLRIRVNPNRPALEDIPDGLKARILGENVLDVELYEFAKARFEREFERCGAAPEYQFLNPGSFR